MDLGLNYEMSRLKVMGDATADRKLRFWKPSITLDWDAGNRWQTQFILRRTVAQLNFFDFISAADLASTEVNGGNANLQPQRSWEARLSAEHPLFGQGKVRLELGYNLISLLQDRILTPEGFDAPGNIGTGNRCMQISLSTRRSIASGRACARSSMAMSKVLASKIQYPGNCVTSAAHFRAGPGRGYSSRHRQDCLRAFDWETDRPFYLAFCTRCPHGAVSIPRSQAPTPSWIFRPRADQTVTLTFTDISNAGAFRDLTTFLP